ncbi:MAG: AAA family ATPase [Bacteroidetes bacterium GWE2_29_8]|nr:MAG: AAA family ATPase [Bacteroidetes bacterium GWE2_29_8]OFY20755.1 MAG: AAA family ATPase [Bacteroidetes bacterium GWF2_29_10]
MENQQQNIYIDSKHVPLPERLRPKNIEEIIGQKHLTGENGILLNMLKTENICSLILWGPPGSGKTTLANVISKRLNRHIFNLSAINSGVKEIREVIEKSATLNGNVILFIDEIHRFNKAQQDSLLSAVEKGTITLIGATTENPSFEVISPLLSRCQVYILNPIAEEDLEYLIDFALEHDEILSKKNITVSEKGALIKLAGGDARKLLNTLEIVVNNLSDKEKCINDEIVQRIIQKKIALYDKSGEQHYDIISAFIKSIRGSDPDAAVYWLARMILGGEDPKFIARRLLILSSEDIGNANPTAFVMANACFQAVNVIGYPECEIILSQTAVYLATSEKSNSTYMAIKKAKQFAINNPELPVPLHLRNSPTKLMKDLNYGKDYKYSHDYSNNFVEQNYLPDKANNICFYNPGKNVRENEMLKRLKQLWKNKYKDI